MVVIEMRDAAYDVAFDLLDEAKDGVKKTKMTLCELEDAIYDCYEASKEDQEYMPEEPMLRGRRDYRHDEQYGVREDEDEMDMRSGMRRMNRRRGMRMRRNRMGQYV